MAASGERNVDADGQHMIGSGSTFVECAPLTRLPTPRRRNVRSDFSYAALL
jgi:hypothetical protein